MSEPLPRILVVDDEEAILETMTFTFQDDYEVYTSTDARKALALLDEKAPFAAVLTDQRMPDMSGVEFVAEVFRRHPSTVRMILTGFSDIDAIIQAINDGHVYAYITKPWEPEQLKQLMKQAVEHNKLAVENERLLQDLRKANVFLEAVMDELGIGAIALDADGVVQAINRPVREYLGLPGEVRGRPFSELLSRKGVDRIEEAVREAEREEGVAYCDVDVDTHRFRVTARSLADDAGRRLGRVLLFREVSHEPLQRRFSELLGDIVSERNGLRPVLETSREKLREVHEEIRRSPVQSSGMSELAERVSRTRTALDNWLEVDDAMARQGFPDANVLQERMRISLARWPLRGELPPRVVELARRVDDYYETGEKAGAPVL
ncbi:MAG TPA: response regulator [Myxococcota bacterium]|nr:response regulator [Myxococcota bacterium]